MGTGGGRSRGDGRHGGHGPLSSSSRGVGCRLLSHKSLSCPILRNTSIAIGRIVRRFHPLGAAWLVKSEFGSHQDCRRGRMERGMALAAHDAEGGRQRGLTNARQRPDVSEVSRLRQASAEEILRVERAWCGVRRGRRLRRLRRLETHSAGSGQACATKKANGLGRRHAPAERAICPTGTARWTCT